MKSHQTVYKKMFETVSAKQMKDMETFFVKYVVFTYLTILPYFTILTYLTIQTFLNIFTYVKGHSNNM